MSKIRNITDWTGFIKNEVDKALTEKEIKAEIYRIAHDFEVDTRFDTEKLNRGDYEELEDVFKSSIGAIQILQNIIEYRVFERIDNKLIDYAYANSNKEGVYSIDFDYLQSEIEDEAVDSIIIHTYEQKTDDEYNDIITRLLNKLLILGKENFNEDNNTLSIFNEVDRTLDIYAHKVIMQYEPISSDTERLETYDFKDGLVYLCNSDDECIQKFEVHEQRENKVNILGVEDSTAIFLGKYASRFHISLTNILEKIGLDSNIKVVKVLKEIRSRACKVETTYKIDDEGEEIEEEIVSEIDLPSETDELAELFDKEVYPIINSTSDADKKHSIKEISTCIQNTISQKLFKINNSGLSKDICLKIKVRYGNEKAFKKYKESLGNNIEKGLKLFESQDRITDAYGVIAWVYRDNTEILVEAIYNVVNSLKARGFKVVLEVETDNIAAENLIVTNKAELEEAIKHLV